MKNLLIFALVLLLASCAIRKESCDPYQVVTATVLELKTDGHPRKKYVILSTGDTLKRIPVDTNLRVGETYTITYANGTRKDCSIFVKTLLQSVPINKNNL